MSLDVNLIAFYLPQFHPIPENNSWWGNGFTEWTNVTRALPNYAGHMQPRLPADLGFYDLRLPEIQKMQARMAKEFGIQGFCYHYYWFDGHNPLGHPLELLLANRDIDINFCLNYANEAWTRRWDGGNNDILLSRGYGNLDAERRFAQSLVPYFRDSRYIRIENRPLLLLYKPDEFLNLKESADIWRDELAKHGIEPYLCSAQTFLHQENPATFGFDASVEFPPHGLNPINYNTSQEESRMLHSDAEEVSITVTNSEFKGKLFNYFELALSYIKRPLPDYKLFRAVCPSWDNTPRRMHEADIHMLSSPEKYRHWLSFVVEQTSRVHKESERYVFINAWNEWAEGAILEPCKQYGYSYLEATKDALLSLKMPLSI